MQFHFDVGFFKPRIMDKPYVRIMDKPYVTAIMSSTIRTVEHSVSVSDSVI